MVTFWMESHLIRLPLWDLDVHSKNIRLFKDLTVLDNVLIAFGNHHKQHVFASFLRLPAFYKSEKELKAKALELLKIFDLDGDAENAC